MPRLAMALGVVLMLFLAGCSAGTDGVTPAAGDVGGGPTVGFVQPADGADVAVPFTLVVESSEELGPSSSGNHHVHLYVDDNDTNYEVIESENGKERMITADSPALAGLTSGEHTLHLSLRNADHSPAGAETEITVNLDLDAATGDGTDSDTGGDGGYGDY